MTPEREMLSTGQYLTFAVADEEYAIGVLQVKEIIPYNTPTKVPKTPPFLRGVINLRGSVVPVLDLSVAFGLPERPPRRQTCIVIVEATLAGERSLWGLVADSVNQVVDLAAEQMEAPPAFGVRGGVHCLAGVGKLGEKLLLILDVDRILAAVEFQALSPLPSPALSASSSRPDETPSNNEGGRHGAQD